MFNRFERFVQRSSRIRLLIANFTLVGVHPTLIIFHLCSFLSSPAASTNQRPPQPTNQCRLVSTSPALINTTTFILSSQSSVILDKC